MLDFIVMQKQMHKKFGFETPDKPSMIKDPDFLKMRLNFMLEEMLETASALGYMLNYEGTKLSFIKFIDKVEPEEVIDGMVDLQVVLLGLADFFGFLNNMEHPKEAPVEDDDITYFEEAFWRVWKANNQKEVCKSADESKRGSKIDLKKPAGWQKPQFKDILEGFFGQCPECGCNMHNHVSLKCSACEAK